jgi:hypothetical protein
MTAEKHNGWKNYETWAVALWIDNDKASSDWWRDAARQHGVDAPTCSQVTSGMWTASEASRFNLADQLKAEISNSTPLKEPTMFADLLNAALAEVDWQEIADHLLKDVREETRPPPNDATPGDWPVIFQYSRADAIGDGVLFDLTAPAKETGIKHPVAVTAGVWAVCVAVPDSPWNNEAERILDLITMLRLAMLRSVGGDRVDFEVCVQTGKRKQQTIPLYALCHPGDDGRTPVITVMLPHED